MADPISNSDDIIDSRNVIARIEELERDLSDATQNEAGEWSSSHEFEGETRVIDLTEEAAELAALKLLAAEGEGSPDWHHGETLIHDDYFTEYTKELIADCYEMPKDFESGNWPWCHFTFDYEAAARDLKVDYFTVDFDGVTYWIRG